MKMSGINSFYYSLVTPYKKRIRNTLLLFKRNAQEGEVLTVDSDALAQLFLIDADNIGGEVYTEEDMLIVEPVLDAFFKGERMVLNLNPSEVQVLIDLAMKRRLTAEQNEPIAVKLAEHYNETEQNELLRIDMDVFRQVCKMIDKPAG